MPAIGWVGSDVFCEMANLDGLLDTAYMEFLSQERITGVTVLPKDFATWKAAVCQDLVIIMVITRADWSRYWWQWAASEFLSLGLRHRDLQNNGWGFSQVGAVGTMEAFRPGKGFLYSIDSLWIRERTIWINFTINLKGAPLFQGRGTETKPWRAMKIEFHLDKPPTLSQLYRFRYLAEPSASVKLESLCSALRGALSCWFCREERCSKLWKSQKCMKKNLGL